MAVRATLRFLPASNSERAGYSDTTQELLWLTAKSRT